MKFKTHAVHEFSVIGHLFFNPFKEVESAREHSVSFIRFASGRSVANRSMYLPHPVVLAYKRSTGIAVAPARDYGATGAGADHGFCDGDGNGLVIQFVTVFVADDREDSLLEVAHHSARVVHLTPTSDITVGSNRGWSFRQASSFDVFIQLGRFFEFEESDVIVEVVRVVFWMPDHLLNSNLNFSAFFHFAIVFTNSYREHEWIMFFSVDTVCCSHHPLRSDKGTSASWSTTKFHQNLPGPTSPGGCLSSDHTDVRDLWFAAFCEIFRKGGGQAYQEQ